jgi:hypothetical protein
LSRVIVAISMLLNELQKQREQISSLNAKVASDNEIGGAGRGESACQRSTWQLDVVRG